jgi:1-acyl-sn-glycerol-3-phosphate acyltransferase
LTLTGSDFTPIHREKAMYTLIIKLASNLIYLIGRLLYGFKVEGLENIPKEGPFILSSNDLSTMGSIFTTTTVIRHVFSGQMETPVSFSEEYNWATEQWAWMFDIGGAIPVPRGRGQAVSALLSAFRALRQGKIVALNPEGETSWEGRLVPAKPAVAWVALRLGAPIVLVVATKGAYDVWPKWAERPHLTGRFQVRVGKPFRLTDSPCSRVSDEMIVRANQRIMEEMTALVYR